MPDPILISPMKTQTEPCRCDQIARVINRNYITNHHENCPHYNDSLMDVWKVTVGRMYCIMDNEQDARDTAGDDGVVTKEKMHREVFDNLPVFVGF